MTSLTTRIQRHTTAHRRTSSAIDGIFAFLRQFFRSVRHGLARRSGRRTLYDLADCNDEHLLRDIGMTRDEAYREAAKWFWQR